MAESAVNYRPSHFGICITDLDRSLRFYCDGLGFEAAERYDLKDTPESGLDRSLEVESPVELVSQFIRNGDMGVELLYYRSPPPSARPRPVADRSASPTCRSMSTTSTPPSPGWWSAAGPCFRAPGPIRESTWCSSPTPTASGSS